MLNAQFVSLNCAILSSLLSVYICVLNLLLPCEMQPHMPRIIHRVKLNGASTFQCDGFSSLNHSHTNCALPRRFGFHTTFQNIQGALIKHQFSRLILYRSHNFLEPVKF